MATKPYRQIEETPVVANEPAVAYQAEMNNRLSSHVPTPYEMEVLRRSEEDYKAGRVYTQEEVDKMLEQWLSWKFFLIYYRILETEILVEGVFDTRQDIV